MEYTKTTISRKKLYEKNYTRDSIEIIEDTDDEVLHSINYKLLIDILTLKYSENKST
ncbi:hypothetical protein [Clostridium paraputrificum]|uniref:hypothetical protein n=1 Tax=Clostridium paraputrificum TaxID=29363 RepID=UPI0034A14625